jgi:tripartite-type tricarboxylate transporter receptor subunit TctC
LNERLSNCTVPGYEASVSFGLFAAAGTPTDVIKKVNADVQNIVSDLEFQNNYLETPSCGTWE